MKEITGKVSPIEEIAYKRYQYNWLMEQKISIHDVLERFYEYTIETLKTCEEEEIPKCEDTVEEWEADDGIYGQIWACFDEFLMMEYLNADYMKHILTKEEFNQYMAKRYWSTFLSEAVMDKEKQIFKKPLISPIEDKKEIAFAQERVEDFIDRIKRAFDVDTEELINHYEYF